MSDSMQSVSAQQKLTFRLRDKHVVQYSTDPDIIWILQSYRTTGNGLIRLCSVCAAFLGRKTCAIQRIVTIVPTIVDSWRNSWIQKAQTLSHTVYSSGKGSNGTPSGWANWAGRLLDRQLSNYFDCCASTIATGSCTVQLLKSRLQTLRLLKMDY
jgi:hypothetical protein